MFLSCKISNSFLNFLEQRGDDFSILYEKSRLPIELLSDSSRWINAPDMEAFLELISQISKKNDLADGDSQVEKSGFDFIQMVAHEGPKLHAWGVLDSVLRMMPEPREILNQPDKFLSYFISPKPPIENLSNLDFGISFDLPLSSEQYPYFTAYMKATFEALPIYVGQPLATCQWENIHIDIRWTQPPPLEARPIESQMESGTDEVLETSESNLESQLESKSELGLKFNSSFFQDIISDLEVNQRILEDERRSKNDLEEKFRDQQKTILKLQKALSKAKKENQLNEITVSRTTELALEQENNWDENYVQNYSLEPRYQVEQNLARLHDYMIRAQQLVMVLTSESGITPSIKKAMKKLNWDFVKTQYPKTVSESMENLRKIQKENSCLK